MRQIVALNLADEDRFLANHPHWAMERRVQDEQGVAWLSFRVDLAAERAERKASIPALIATRAIYRDQPVKRSTKPFYVGEIATFLERRTYRYRPELFELQLITVIAPALMEVPKVRMFHA